MSFTSLKTMVLLWWLLNIIQSLQYHQQFRKPPRTANWPIFCKYLRFIELTTFQFFIGGIMTGGWLKLTLKRPLYPTGVNPEVVVIILSGNMVEGLALNAAYYLHTWHLREILRSWEPVLMFVLLIVLGYQRTANLSGMVLVGLVAMATGLSIFRTCQRQYTTWGVLVASLSAVALPVRNVFLKSFGDSWNDPLQKYAVLSIYGFLLLLPLCLAKLAYTRIFPFIKLEDLFLWTILQVTNSLISIFVLESICPLFHALLTTTMQLPVTIVTIVYLQPQISWNMLAGLTMFASGLMLYYAKTVTRHAPGLKRTTGQVVVALYVIFGIYLVLHFTKKSMVTVRPIKTSLVRTFWVYEQPPSEDILLNIRRMEANMPAVNVHVHCATFICVEKIRLLRNPRIIASFLTFNDFVRNSPLEEWFSRHALHKLLSGKSFEHHLHEATRLALLWHFGGTYLDPFLRIQKIHLQEFKNHPWIAISPTEKHPGLLHICNFPGRHPLIEVLSHSFLTQYRKETYVTDNFKDFLWNFQNASLNALSLFCNTMKQHCPKRNSLQYTTLKPNNDYAKRHFAVILEKSNSNISGILENFAMVQFFPFVDIFLRSSNNHKLKTYPNTTSFVNFRWTGNTSASYFRGIADIIILSRSIDFQKIPSPKHIEFLRRHAPIGCSDTETLNFLRKQGVEAYYFEKTLFLVKNQYLLRNSGDYVYLVDVDEETRKQLPVEIQRNGLVLDSLKISKFKSKWRGRLIAAYEFMEKFASARLIITENIQWALMAAAMDSPLLYINSSRVPNNTVKFYAWSLNQESDNNTVKLIRNLNSSQFSRIPNANVLMRLRATAWNAIRKHQRLREAALKFGVVPFSRPVRDNENNLTFHLIFTTSNQSSISLSRQKSTVKGGFGWRHWRCVEAIFYHHSFARVIIHSNTLSQSSFDVLTEAGYDLRVHTYSLDDLAKGTPAEVFVRDELAYAKEGEHWYSHETDLLRLLVLFKWGGIYMDTDIIVVRPLQDLPWNTLGWESSFHLNGAFLKFQKGHSFLEACIRKFSHHYAQAWSENGPLLLSRVWNVWNGGDSESDVTTLSTKAFYMFFYRTIVRECFEETSGDSYDINWKVLREQAYAVHLYSKVTAEFGSENNKIKNGTLCKHILNSFCVVCDKTY